MVYKIIQIHINAFHRSFEGLMTSIHTYMGKTQSSITNNLSQTLASFFRVENKWL
jgi:hypothetical protein